MGNNSPIFSSVANVQWGTISAANTAKDGTGTVVNVFTSNPTNGSYVQSVVVRPLGTNVATVMRVFLNNGQSNTVAANNILIDERTLSATTVSETAGNTGNEIPINRPIPPGYRIFVTLGTAVSAGFSVSVWGGDY